MLARISTFELACLAALQASRLPSMGSAKVIVRRDARLSPRRGLEARQGKWTGSASSNQEALPCVAARESLAVIPARWWHEYQGGGSALRQGWCTRARRDSDSHRTP